MKIKLIKDRSKRFADSKQELSILTMAGVVRDLAASKGGHNPKEWNGRKKGEKRVKKVPYNKKAWGTIGSQEYKYPVSRYEQKPSVIKQFQKSEAYKAKINSKRWKKAAGER